MRAPSATPLGPLTTLRLGGPAGRLVDARTEAELVDAVRDADAAGEAVLVLAGGSNVVVADAGFPGLVVRVLTEGVQAEELGGDRVRLTVQAGEPWDPVVARSVREGLAGLECLSGIPGSTGATPIQNVGAYGQEVATTIESVRAYDRAARAVADLPASACGFRYRGSRFKGAATHVVLAVTFVLARSPLSEPIRYAELARALGVRPGDRVPLAAAREAVLRLRRGKGMVVDPEDPDSVSAGSFFTNPVLEPEAFAALERRAARAWGPTRGRPRSPSPTAASRPPPRGSSSAPASARAWSAAASASRPSTRSRSSTAATPRRPSSSRSPPRSPPGSVRPSASTSSPSPSSSGMPGRRRRGTRTRRAS